MKTENQDGSDQRSEPTITGILFDRRDDSAWISPHDLEQLAEDCSHGAPLPFLTISQIEQIELLIDNLQRKISKLKDLLLLAQETRQERFRHQPEEKASC